MNEEVFKVKLENKRKEYSRFIEQIIFEITKNTYILSDLDNLINKEKKELK